MLLWLIFYIVELFLLSLANIVTEYRNKKLLYSASAICAIYFSAFRNGLGTDYKGYIAQMSSMSELGHNSNSEPLFNFIKDIVLGTDLSPVFFFAACAIITIWFFWKYLDNIHNEFASLSIIIFLSLPGLYFNTFNVVRQYFAAAIFLFSLRFIASRQFFYYTLCIVVAFMMHTSAIILIPLYFVLNKSYSFKTYIIFGIVLIAGAYSLNPIFDTLSVLSDRYSIYLDSDEEAGKSTITLLCLVILTIFFIKYRQYRHKGININSTYLVMTINMFILYSSFSLLTFINFYFYRLTIYFGASLCVMMPFAIYLILKNKNSVSIICLLFSFIYFLAFITMGKDNPEMCSDSLLPISSLFDISPI